MLRILEVPKQFLPKMPIEYPPHQGTNSMIEEKCFEYFTKNYNNIDSDYIYLPIQWTAFHLLNGYGQNVQPLIDYYRQVTEQFPDEKFFTVVQYDGGTLVALDNCKVFACSGSFTSPIGKNSTYEAVPLMCDPHPVSFNYNSDKKYKVVFSGRITHDIRKSMFSSLSGLDGYNLYDPSGVGISNRDVEIFRELVDNSIFGLCPRGYGPTSFRLYETIQMGCIPIFISDEFWLPFEEYIDWKKLSLLITPDEIDKIPLIVDKLIESGEYKDMIEYGKYCYENYFSWDGLTNTIGKIIQKNDLV